jgi:DNA repair exonuclease SbcCD nuclease subunit
MVNVMIRLLHTADLHLGATLPELGAGAARRQADVIETFERIITLAIKSEVHLLLVAGDLFDSPWPSQDLLGRVEAALRRLHERGIQTVLLPGDKEAVAAADRWRAFPGALVVKPSPQAAQTLMVAGRPVHFQAVTPDTWNDDVPAEPETSPVPGVRIGLLYLVEPFKDGIAIDSEQVDDLAFDYLALGGFHQYRELTFEERLCGCCPGSPEGLRFGENGARYCALVTLEEGRVAVERHTVNRRFLEERTLALDGCDDQEEAGRRILDDASANLLLRLTLTGQVEIPLDAEQLRRQCEDAFFTLQLTDQTRLLDSRFAARVAQESTVRGLLVRRARALRDRVAPDQHSLVEEGLREVLVRCRRLSGEEP